MYYFKGFAIYILIMESVCTSVHHPCSVKTWSLCSKLFLVRPDKLQQSVDGASHVLATCSAAARCAAELIMYTATTLYKLRPSFPTFYIVKLQPPAENTTLWRGRQSSIIAHTLFTVAAESGEGDPPAGPPILLLRNVSPSSGAPAVQLRFPVCHWS